MKDKNTRSRDKEYSRGFVVGARVGREMLNSGAAPGELQQYITEAQKYNGVDYYNGYAAGLKSAQASVGFRAEKSNRASS